MTARIAMWALLLAMPIAALPDQNISGVGQVTLGNSQGKANTLKTGTLVTTATTADQVLVTYTVTAGKTLFVEYLGFTARLTTFAATATNFGTCSLESPAGTKLYTQMVANAGAPNPGVYQDFPEPVPIASGTVVRLVCTPGATTSYTWVGNLGGYER